MAVSEHLKWCVSNFIFKFKWYFISFKKTKQRQEESSGVWQQYPIGSQYDSRYIRGCRPWLFFSTYFPLLIPFIIFSFMTKESPFFLWFILWYSHQFNQFESFILLLLFFPLNRLKFCHPYSFFFFFSRNWTSTKFPICSRVSLNHGGAILLSSFLGVRRMKKSSDGFRNLR